MGRNSKIEINVCGEGLKTYKSKCSGVYRVMKRKLTIAGIFVGLAAAMVLAVLVISYRPKQPAPRDSLTLTPDGKVVVQPIESRSSFTVVSDMPRGGKSPMTNNASASSQ